MAVKQPDSRYFSQSENGDKMNVSRYFAVAHPSLKVFGLNSIKLAKYSRFSPKKKQDDMSVCRAFIPGGNVKATKTDIHA